MNNKTQYYKFPRAWWCMVKDMDAHSQGAFLRAVNAYIFDGTEPTDLPPVAQGVFIAIKVEYDTTKEKQDIKIDRLRENGRKGGITKAQNIANASNCYQPLANASNCYQPLANASNCYEKSENLAPANKIVNTTHKEGCGFVVASASTPMRTSPLPLFNFENWWELYGLGDKFDGDEVYCRSRFESIYQEGLLPKLKAYTEAYVKATPMSKRKQPRYFFIDQIWKNDPSTIKGTKAAPHYLEGSEMEQYWSVGQSVYIVRVGEGTKTVCAEDVEKFKLTVVSEMKPQK